MRALQFFACLAVLVGTARLAHAQEQRPDIGTNRWLEDWSVLADPALRTEPLDSLKYIRLWGDDPHTFLSLGLTLRERVELNDAIGFTAPEDGYLLQRLQVHADLRVDRHLRLFVQLEDVRAFAKTTITPVDENPVDARVLFVEYIRKFASWRLKTRVGRQDFAFDLQRFASLRDGPNVRQSFDAAWAELDVGDWRVIGFASLPVEYRHDAVFDDTPSTSSQFHMFRVERHVLGTNELSAYYASYESDGSKFLDATGNEHRNIFDARFAGKGAGIHWDVEAMAQLGTIGTTKVRAWAVGARQSYDVTHDVAVGIQLDGASGDKHHGDGVLGTFNSLYPNGYYFTQAGDTAYTNLYHIKPYVLVTPARGLLVLGGVGLQWRETTADAVYLQPGIPIASTAGQPGAWTGWYAQVRADYRFTANVTAAVETVHFQVGDVIRRAGGGNSEFIGIEGKLAW